MAWYLNNTRIYVEEDSGWKADPRKGTIELLDTNYSIIQSAGRPSYERDITFVVFSGYTTNILPIITTASIVLIDDSGTSTDVSIMKLAPTRLYDYSGREVFRVNTTLKQVD
jgi:hypothetical protein